VLQELQQSMNADCANRVLGALSLQLSRMAHLFP
jgi:hypothetical protein